MSKNSLVDKYIDSLPDWQKDICEKARNLIHKAEPEIIEIIKRTKLPYFTYKGNVCAFLATKHHVNIFIYDPIAPDPENIINQGKQNSTARAIQIYEEDKLNEKALINLIRAICKNNENGGWRKLKK